MTISKNAAITLNLYDSLVRTGNFIRGYSSYGSLSTYSQEKRSLGGFYSMTFAPIESFDRLADWILFGLDRHVEVKDQKLNITWEGFVNQITVTFGPLEFSTGPTVDTRTRAKVVFSPIDTSVNPQASGARTSTAFSSDANAVARYGISDYIESLSNATTAQTALDARSKVLLTKAFPQTSRDSSLQPGDFNIEIECLGYWHKLDTYIYNASTSGTQTYRDKITNVLDANPNGGVFSTDYTKIDDPTSENIFSYEDKDRTAMDVITEIVGLGDSSFNRYVAGFGPGRRFYYNAIPDNYQYRQRLVGSPDVRDRQQGDIDPYDIEPGQWIFYPDLVTGQALPRSLNDLRSDLRTGFIETVEYSIPDDLSVNGVKVNTLDQFLAKVGLKAEGV